MHVPKAPPAMLAALTLAETVRPPMRSMGSMGSPPLGRAAVSDLHHVELTVKREDLEHAMYPDPLDKIIDAPIELLTREELEAQNYAHKLIAQGVITFRRTGSEERVTLTDAMVQELDADQRAQLQRGLRAGVKSELAKWLAKRAAEKERSKLERRAKKDGSRKERKAKRAAQKSSRKRNRR